MADYDCISRRKAIAYINKVIPKWSEDKEIAIDCLKNMPCEDVVAVVRCGECIHSEYDENNYISCGGMLLPNGDWFCPEGERR